MARTPYIRYLRYRVQDRMRHSQIALQFLAEQASRLGVSEKDIFDMLKSGMSAEQIAAVEDPSEPVNGEPPAIVPGTLRPGDTATMTPGTWTGKEPIELLEEILLDGEVAGTGSLEITPAMYDKDVSARVTATNDIGSTVATSAPVTVSGIAPANTAAPTISGTIRVGQTASATTGTWTGTPTPTYTYQWFRGNTAISGATSATYAIVAADAGQTLRVQVTATNAEGSDTASSSNTAAVAYPPENVLPPEISGPTEFPGTLSCSTGTWNGAPTITYTYRWTRNGTTISGATSSTYALMGNDVSATLACEVTATNADGSSSFSAAGVGPITSKPSSVTQPVASGTPTVGETLEVTTGTWSGYPAVSSYTYQWYRGYPSQGPIDGATLNSYVLTAEETDLLVWCEVTAINAVGQASMNSNELGPVAAE